MSHGVVESGGMLAAGALLTGGKVVGAGELWAGRPAKLVRSLGPTEAAFILDSARARVYRAAVAPTNRGAAAAAT